MKTLLLLIPLSLLCSLNAAPVKHTRVPKTTITTTTTTDAGFVAKYFRIPDFLKFSQQEKPTEPPIKTLELPQKSKLSKILDSINIFKKAKPFGEPYLRAYIQPDGSYKWYFVYPGQMLYPAPDQFSFDTLNQALQKTTPTTTTTTTTTTTEPPPEEMDGTPKPLYPLMGKIEFYKNESEPKETKWAITISESGPIFQPFGKIQPPFDEPLLQQLQGDDQDEQEPQEGPDNENQSATRRRHRKHTRTPQPVDEEDEESPAQAQEPVEDEPQEEAREDNPAEYEDAEHEQNEPSEDDGNPGDENGSQDQYESEQKVEEESQDEEPAPAESAVTKSKSLKPS